MNIRRSFLVAGAAVLAAAGATSTAPPAAADPLPYGPDTCINGYVWRNARPGDAVCVTPQERDTVAQENANPGANKDPNGAYGPESCASGYVWRQAFDGDTICVLPGERTTTLADNAAADSRKAANQPQGGPSPASTVLFEIYSDDPGGQVAEIDVDSSGIKLGPTALPYSNTQSIRGPKNLRLRAYGNGQHRIGCRITVNGQQVVDVMNGPVAICSWSG